MVIKRFGKEAELKIISASYFVRQRTFSILVFLLTVQLAFEELLYRY